MFAYIVKKNVLVKVHILFLSFKIWDQKIEKRFGHKNVKVPPKYIKISINL